MTKTYFVIVLLKSPSFHGKLPFLYNATYISRNKAIETMNVFRDQYPDNNYIVCSIDVPLFEPILEPEAA